MLKKLFVIAILTVLINAPLFSQFKNTDKPINKSTSNLILGIFNPKNFTMNHSFQVSMLSSQYGNITLTSYVNSMNYRFSEKLSVSADVKMQYSPFTSSAFGKSYAQSVQDNLNGLFLSRLSLDYKISENSYLKFEFRNLRDGGSYYDRYNNPYYNDGFLR